MFTSQRKSVRRRKQPALSEPLLLNSSMVRVLEATTEGLRHLDDQEGGDADNLQFVHKQFREVGIYLRHCRCVSFEVQRRLLAARAEISQIAGWMAYDAERHDSARRYFQIGLHAARAAGSLDLGAHILACMAYQSAYLTQLDQALDLAEQAYQVSVAGAVPAVQALVLSRRGHVYAALGEALRSRRDFARAHKLLSRNSTIESKPGWLYWFDEAELETQRGHSLVALALSLENKPHHFLTEAEKLLIPKASTTNTHSPRDALFHGAWLARSYIRHGEIEQALEVGRTALRRLRQVRSRRSVTLLKAFDRELAASAAGIPAVEAFREQLHRALAA